MIAVILQVLEKVKLRKMAKRERDFDEFEDVRFCCLGLLASVLSVSLCLLFRRVARRLALTPFVSISPSSSISGMQHFSQHTYVHVEVAST